MSHGKYAGPQKTEWAIYLVVGPEDDPRRAVSHYLAVEMRPVRDTHPGDIATRRTAVRIADDNPQDVRELIAAARAAAARLNASEWDAEDQARRLYDNVSFARTWGKKDFSKCDFCGGPTPCLRDD